MARIRPATRRDREPLLALMRAMHAESQAYRHLPLCERACRRFIRRLTRSRHGCLQVAETPDRALVGAIFAYASMPFFSRVRIPSEHILYVYPEHRGGRSAVQLVNAYLGWAAVYGAPEARVGVSVDIDDDRAVRLYERLGFELAGRTLRVKLRS